MSDPGIEGLALGLGFGPPDPDAIAMLTLMPASARDSALHSASHNATDDFGEEKVQNGAIPAVRVRVGDT